jgi:sporulation protein YlmC with PRC-barrel domain
MARSAAEILNDACAFDLMRVQGTDGRFLGHVFDLRCPWQPGQAEPPVVEEIVFGRAGLAERVGLIERQPHGVPWSAVREVREEVIVVDAAAVPARSRGKR